MKQNLKVWVLASLLLAIAHRPAAAAINVKLATLAPEGSIWDQSVKEMGAEWQQATGGRVQLRVYPGGVAGDEPDVVRKMRIGQLHAAVLTVSGLTDIDEAFEVFTIPLFFDSYDELYYVLDKLRPTFEQRLQAKGYQLLSWGNGGWVHLFSTKPLPTVADLKASKLFVAAGDDERVQWWQNNGFRPVALATTDVLTGLQTGMIEAMPSPPLAALLLQWYRQAPYMLDLGVAPLVGATVITSKVWQQIAPADQAAILAAAKKVEERLNAEVPEQDRKSIAEMQKRQLTVVPVPADAAKSWEAAAEEFANNVRNTRVPPEVLQQALAARAEYRKAHPAGGAEP